MEKVSSCFSKKCPLREWNFLFCVALFNPDWSKVTQSLFWWSIWLFELWSAWNQHVAFSLMNVSMKRFLPACFNEKEDKSIVSVFSSTYFLFASSSLSVGLVRLGLFRNSFLTIFFQINKFLQETTQFQEEQSEVPLEGLHAFVHLLDNKELVHLYS